MNAVSFADEPLILVDRDDVEVGHLEKAACHLGGGILHRAFSVFLFAPDGRVLLQRRSRAKPLWPTYWSNTCCSHPRRGEAVEAAAHRRLREEMQLEAPLTFAYKFVYQARYGDVGAEHEMCSVFVGPLAGEAVVHPDEIMDTRLVAPAELDRQLAQAPAAYTPWLHMEWRTLRAEHAELLGPES